jgi:hypothetical protein
MLAHWTHEKRGRIDVMSITADDFSTWRLSGYNPRGDINPNPVAPAVLPGARVNAGGIPVEQFQHGIKKDKDHYPEFKDEKYWDSFHRSVETVAFTHGVQDVLQGNFVPPVGDANARALFLFQNIFMYSVFEAKIKTNKGMSIVRSHGNDRKAQDVWKELVAHQTTSTTGKWNRQHLLTFLQTFKLDSASW